MYCQQCGAAIKAGDIFCAECGTKHQQPNESPLSGSTKIIATKKLDISWIFKSIGIFILTFMGVYIVIGFMIFALLGDNSINLNNPMLLTLIIISNLFVFFIGGFISAYLSPGITLKEPAIAVALLATLTNLLTQDIGTSFVAWIIPYFIAYFGAKYGEQLQQVRRA
ncbi:MAG: hypothetical protein methR_P0423 [Methyloprofundus sp.]|nr:MAG: hypothetical protein methR_P0423 [Methyloprofundus sp.]